MAVERKGDRNRWSVESSLEELAQLTRTAGAEVVGSLRQKLNQPSPSHYLGQGKLQELKALKSRVGYDLVIFDDELSPVQQRNVEDALEVKVIDRTALILDIFARQAQTREGKLQVKLAQNEYLLPRLAGQWSHLERLGGGIGTRGPGEPQLETDRRLVRQQIHRLKAQIEEVRQHRRLYRLQRKRQHLSIVALVGYTNAGKSTLLNALSHAHVSVEDKLFTTLDPVTRRLFLPNRQEVLLTDTVGFIQKLPTTVIAAFRATLEELAEADLLLHVVDITHENAAEQSETVDDVLEDLGLAAKPRLLVLNKVDLLLPEQEPDGEAALASLSRQLGMEVGTVLVSAARGWGLGRLLEAMVEALSAVEAGVGQQVPALEVIGAIRSRASAGGHGNQELGAGLSGKVVTSIKSEDVYQHQSIKNIGGAK